jgi:hypothetical protein
MKIFIAGSNTRNVTNYCREYNVPKLHSILGEKKEIERWEDGLMLMVDSGAHSWNKEGITKVGMSRKSKLPSANLFIESYFQFIKTYKDKKIIWFEFDVYGHLPKQQIDDYHKRVQDLGIAGHFLRVYHPTLDGGSLDLLREWIEAGETFVGIANDSIDMVDRIFAITQDKIKVHGLAMTKIGLVERLPFYSVDSTSPLSTVIFGRYALPLMGYEEREDIHKRKSIKCYHEDEERIKNAVIETKRTQDYLTDLWSIRNITWLD